MGGDDEEEVCTEEEGDRGVEEVDGGDGGVDEGDAGTMRQEDDTGGEEEGEDKAKESEGEEVVGVREKPVAVLQPVPSPLKEKIYHACNILI